MLKIWIIFLSLLLNVLTAGFEDMDNILIFGTGSSAEYFISNMDRSKVNILAAINTNRNGGFYHEYPVIDLKQAKEYDYDYILICSGYVDEITVLLVKNGFDPDRITSFIYDNPSVYDRLGNSMKHELDEKYHRFIAKRWFKESVSLPEFYPTVVWNEDLSLRSCVKDFVKEQTLRIIDRLTEAVSGDIAELGCYRGDFSVVLDKYFLSSEYYIFDSFEGFKPDDVAEEKDLPNKQGEYDKFRDTSEDLVMSRLQNKERTHIIKGYFPESYKLEGKRYKFVCIDLNLYNPVRSALDLFYPLLVDGGYILVSDYFAPFYKGSKAAVDDWRKENHVPVIPVADQYGSVIIGK